MVMTGVIVGLAGVALLVGPGSLGGAAVDRVGAIVLIGGSLSWAIGSLYSKRARMPRSPLLATAMEMLAGGALLLVVAAMTGEIGAFHASAVTTRSAVAVLYLITFGSLVGFSAYVWLLRAVSPARVSTYAYVNPVVAVFLGWALAGEPITARTLVAAAIIIGAVALITGGQQKKLVVERREATPREHEAAPAKRARSA
jgi:drug/metabolite transporter (DMT)-like permease